jgi:protein-disulfide isomerase
VIRNVLAGGALVLSLALAGCGGEQQQQQPGAEAPAGGQQGAAGEAPGGDWTQVVTQTPEGGFKMGNPNAPVQLVEYASMTCPACANFAEQSRDELKDRYVRTGQVSFEFRNFVLNPLDLAATMLVRCQGAGPFFRLTEQLFAEQRQWAANITPEEGQRISQIQSVPQQLQALAQAAELDQFFRRRGMPEARVESCLADQQELERITQIASVAVNEHNVQGTPTFLLNGETMRVSDWPSVERELQQRLGR